MGIFNSLNFDGENSLDYGVYITGEGAYNAPERAVERVSIPGRNGDLLIDQGRFENIEVTYPAGVTGTTQEEMAQRLRAFRNVLASRYSYVRLMDSYHKDEFRLAVFRSGLEAEPVSQGHAAEFEITFDCKPQRFLNSGQYAIKYPRSWGKTETASGAIASFEADSGTGIKSITANIIPAQDLNGYDHPWVGGAGKNLLPTRTDGWESTSNGVTIKFNSDGSITLNGTATAITIWNLISNTALQNRLYLPAGDYIISCDEIIESGQRNNFWVGLYINAETGSWNATTRIDAERTFTVNEGEYVFPRIRIGSGVTLNNLTIRPYIELGSTATSWEPYSNICPISGHTSVSVTRAGKNLLELRESGETQTASGVTFDWLADGTIRIDGTATANLGVLLKSRTSEENKIYLPVGTYVVSGMEDIDDSGAYVGINVNSTSGAYTATSKGTTTFTIEEGDYAYPRVRIPSGMTLDNYICKPMIRLASETDATYEPYEGETYTTDLGQTVYGGTLDLVSGVLTVDRAMVDLGTLTWTRNTTDYSYAYFYSGGIAGYKAGELVCSHYPFASGDKAGLTTDKTIAYYSASSTRIALRDDSYTDATAFKTAMDGVQAVYYLATPQTYQLTPHEVEALIGTNHVYSDAGTVTVVYGADPSVLANPTPYDAKPLIAMHGSGLLRIGDFIVSSTAPTGTTVYIDCESMEMYYYVNGQPVNAGALITLYNNDFPVIKPGTNKVIITTANGVDITPRWWIL